MVLKAIKKSFNCETQKASKIHGVHRNEIGRQNWNTLQNAGLRETYAILCFQRFVLGLDITSACHCSILCNIGRRASCCNLRCVPDRAIYSTGLGSGSRVAFGLLELGLQALTLLPQLKIVALAIVIFFLRLISTSFGGDDPAIKLFCLRDLLIELATLLLVPILVLVRLTHQTGNLVLSCARLLISETLLSLLELVLELTILGPQSAHLGFDLIHADPEGTHHLSLIQSRFQLCLGLSELIFEIFTLLDLLNERNYLFRQCSHGLTFEECVFGHDVLSFATQLGVVALKLFEDAVSHLNDLLEILNLVHEPLVLLLVDKNRLFVGSSLAFDLFRSNCTARGALYTGLGAS